jgi:flavin reductase (DIM6/NTAB) family NADH-FMN oxidoreductase RutF
MTMRQWVTGVTVVTSMADGFRGGMTVSSFTSVSLEPPTVLVCLNKITYTHKLVEKAGVYAVSMLSSGQEDVSNRFAGFDPRITEHDQRFDGVELITAVTGAPLIAGALGWLDCRVITTHETATHTIFIAEVVFAQANAANPPLVYYNRSYQLLTPVEQPS